MVKLYFGASTIGGDDIAAFNWLFLKKYFHEDTRNAMRSKFYNLKQLDMIVMEYEMKFLAMAHFATTQLTDDYVKGA